MRSLLPSLLVLSLSACGSTEHDGESMDAGNDGAPDDMHVEDDAAPGDGNGDGDVGPGDGGNPDSEVPPEGLGNVRAEILSPTSGAQYYAFEDVTVRGFCHPVLHGLPEPSARFTSGDDSVELAKGLELTHHFDVGTHKVDLVCRDDFWGLEDKTEIELTILPTPSIVYGANGKTRSMPGSVLYATALDQLGQATRISPENEDFSARIFDFGYNGAGDRVFVDGVVKDSFERVVSLVTPCRDAGCEGDELPYQELVPDAARCDPVDFVWAPDGHAAFASFQCGGVQTKSLYWINLSGVTRAAIKLESASQWAMDDGRAVFTGDGDVLVFQTGQELKAMDARDDEHPVVSLGSVARASWGLSPARDRLLVLSDDEGFVLDASKIIAEGAAARVEIPFEHQGVHKIFPLTEHVVYEFERVQGSAVFHDHGIMRWDGTHDGELCQDCQVTVCGDHVLTSRTGLPPSLKRIVKGASSDFEQVALAANAPVGVYGALAQANCSLMTYATEPGKSPRIIVDVDTGEWVVAEAALISRSAAYVVTTVGDEHVLHTLERAPLSLSAPSVSWTGDSVFAFSPDSKHLVFVGEHEGVKGAHHVALPSAQVSLIPDFSPRSITFSEDGSKLLGHTGKGSTNALSELDLATLTVRWKTEPGTADWGMLRSDYAAVPNASAVSYLALFTDDDEPHVFRSELSGESHDFGPSRANSWGVSPDGTRLGTRDAEGVKLWSFDAAGTAAPLAHRSLPPLRDASSLYTFEVSADGMFGSDTDMGETFWLANGGQVSALSFPLGTRYMWATRGPAGAPRGMLVGSGEAELYGAWIDFANPSAPVRLDTTDVPARIWHESKDRRYQLRGSIGALRVLDLVDAQSRAVVPADASVPVPTGDLIDSIVVTRLGKAAFLTGGRLYWLDLHTGLLTASQVVDADKVADANDDLSRVVLCAYDSYTSLISVTPGGDIVTLHEASDPAQSARCPSEPGRNLSPDGRWLYVETSAGGGFLVSLNGSVAPTPAPGLFEFQAFDRTSRFVLGVQAAITNEIRHKVAVWSLENPTQVSVVSPAEFQIYEHENAIWVP